MSPYTVSYGDGGAQWAIPQADIDQWLCDSSFASGAGPFRAAMRHHAKGVAVITAGTETPIGFCATSLSSVSLDPPLVSFTVGLGSSSWQIVANARHAMVHLLTARQEDLARRFGQSDVPRFGPQTRWHRDAFGLPVLDDVLAWLVLALTNKIPVGDHAIIIGRVIASKHTQGGRPLIHHNGDFTPLAASSEPADG